MPIDDAKLAMREALRDLEQYARIEQTVETRRMLREAIVADLADRRIPDVLEKYKVRPCQEPRHIKDDA